MAEQEEPVRRRVALKIIKLGMESVLKAELKRICPVRIASKAASLHAGPPWTNSTNSPADKLRNRVITAADAALKAGGSVGPLELFEHMGLLHHSHVEGWRKGNQHYRVLEQWIQVGAEKLEKTLRCFAAWAQARGLRSFEACYTSRTPRGIERLQVTDNRDLEREKFYHTHYAPPDLSARKTQHLAEKLTKPPDLVVLLWSRRPARRRRPR